MVPKASSTFLILYEKVFSSSAQIDVWSRKKKRHINFVVVRKKSVFYLSRTFANVLNEL